MRVVLVGGGTGGHFYPLIAVADALKDRAASIGGMPELLYFGPEPYDQETLTSHGIRYIYCPSGKFRRYTSILNVISPFLLTWGILVAIVKLFWHYPDVVFSKGGYASVPVIIAARALFIPIVIHESDTKVGRANKLGGRFARYIAISYAETAQYFPEGKTALVGIPIRKTLFTAGTAGAAPAVPGLLPDVATILVLGGSSGAERINNLVFESLDELLPTYQIIHQTGKDLFTTAEATAEALVDDKTLLSRYHPVPFFSAEALAQVYAAASLVISRAGSTTIFENAVHGLPSILIPIPEDISHDQRSNAYTYARSGGAIVMEEGNLRDGLLAAEIERILTDEPTYRSMSNAARAFAPTDSAGKVADALIRIAGEH